MDEARGYHRWILRHFMPFLGDRIVELGAGTGSFAQSLLEIHPPSQITLYEPAVNLFPFLQQRFKDRNGVALIHDHLDERAASVSADTVVMVNVLEHIKDDSLCLRHIHRVLAPGGHLLLFVPALPALFGSLDRAFEHFRRYTKRGLRQTLDETGFHIEQIRYFNMIGVAAWFWSGKILKRKMVPERDVRFFDRWIVPAAARLEDAWEPPLGQSLLVIAGKQDSRKV
ncbi:MAG: class I SAM-dependent methyltransferase [Candidatus Acidiferrales bacterium]